MTREQALTAIKAYEPAQKAARTLCYADARGIAAGTGYTETVNKTRTSYVVTDAPIKRKGRR